MQNFQLPNDYLDTEALLERLQHSDAASWEHAGLERALDLFQRMSKRVPAYKDFLVKSKINPDLVKTLADFQQIPTVDKNNYLREYPLDALSWDGTLSKEALTVSSTSGSTGEPFYFPRSKWQDWQYAIMAELYLKTNFNLERMRTLYIVGFPMGQWIGGVFTFEAVRLIAQKTNMPLSIITPGVNPIEILKTMEKIGSYFDQIIIGTYGPFLKDTIDESILSGFDWKRFKMGFIFAAEVFSESFRDYVQQKTGLSCVLTDTLNQYGTVDLGTMSYETPISILTRRRAMAKKRLFNELFNKIYRTPTLTQFFPELFYFESDRGNLYCSAHSGLPLVRYDLKDRGEVLSYDKLIEITESHSEDIGGDLNTMGLKHTHWKLPFVYVYERSDFSVSYYAFNIYPETIRRSLLLKEAQKFCTEKFTMYVITNKSHNQKLVIHIELKKGVEESRVLGMTLTHIIRTQLLKENSAYKRVFEIHGPRINPKIVLWPHQHPKYFNPLIKQRWVKK